MDTVVFSAGTTRLTLKGVKKSWIGMFQCFFCCILNMSILKAPFELDNLNRLRLFKIYVFSRFITILAIEAVRCQICDTSVHTVCSLVTTNDIINFAFTHKVFTCKELIANFLNIKQISSPGSLSEQLNRHLKSGLLIWLEHGVYSLPDNARKNFSVVCSEEMQRIN